MSSTDPLATLRTLLDDSGLSIVELAGVLGRDERMVRRWLARTMAIPGAAADQIQRLHITGITSRAVRLEYRR